MSRPKPIVLLHYTDTKNYKTEQVLKATAIYAVFYDDSPINLRIVSGAFDDTPKYKKVSFSNPGHAFNLADKLNRRFKTDRFTVHRLVQGERIAEPRP